MSQHTPGPWTIDDDSETGSFDIRNTREQGHLSGVPGRTVWGIATVWHQSGGESRGLEDRGNARLIATAPELLAALKAIVDAPHASMWEPISAAVEAARAVIAKAEG